MYSSISVPPIPYDYFGGIFGLSNFIGHEKKKPGWLGYIGDDISYPVKKIRDYGKYTMKFFGSRNLYQPG